MLPADMPAQELADRLEPGLHPDCYADHALQVVTIILDRNQPVDINWLRHSPHIGQVKEIISHMLETYQISPRIFIKNDGPSIQCSNSAVAHQLGYIYLLEALDGEFYKIGRTANLDDRIRTFGVQLPFPVSLRHSLSVPDMACAELALHRHFSAERVNGEWFRLNPEQVNWLCRLHTISDINEEN